MNVSDWAGVGLIFSPEMSSEQPVHPLGMLKMPNPQFKSFWLFIFKDVTQYFKDIPVSIQIPS